MALMRPAHSFARDPTGLGSCADHQGAPGPARWQGPDSDAAQGTGPVHTHPVRVVWGFAEGKPCMQGASCGMKACMGPNGYGKDKHGDGNVQSRPCHPCLRPVRRSRRRARSRLWPSRIGPWRTRSSRATEWGACCSRRRMLSWRKYRSWQMSSLPANTSAWVVLRGMGGGGVFYYWCILAREGSSALPMTLTPAFAYSRVASSPCPPQRAVQARAVQGCGKGRQGMLPCTCLEPAGVCGGRGRLCRVHEPALETVCCCGLATPRCSIYCALSCVPAGTLETSHRNKLFTYTDRGDIRISKHSQQRTPHQSTPSTTTCLRLQE